MLGFIGLLVVVGVLGTLALLVWQPHGSLDAWAVCRFIERERIPVLPVVYLSLVCGIFHVFQTHAAPLLSWPLRAGAWAVTLAALGSFTIALYASPTVVTQRNAARLGRRWVADGLVFPRVAQRCATCDLAKPARSKHCRVCDVCVAGFDHHCLWLNVCVTTSNKRFFLAFLWFTVVACAYCVVSCLLIVARMGHTQSLWEFVVLFLSRGGVYLGMAWITFVLGLSLLAFFLFHVRLVLRGETHNEATKRERLRRASQQAGTENAIDWANPYDRGYWGNLWDCAFPREEPPQ